MTVQAVTVASPDGIQNVKLATWAAMANGDTGAPLELPHHEDKTFQLAGTLGASGTCVLKGSNDGVLYYALKDKQGNASSLTALGIWTTQDNPRYVRPEITNGDGTTLLVVTALCKAKTR